MAAQIAALKAPSDSLLTFLFPSPQKLRDLLKRTGTQQDLWATLLQDPQVRKELERLSKAVKEVARPVSLAPNVAEVERVAVDQLSTYLVWKGELFALILNALNQISHTQFLKDYADAIQQFQNFFDEKAARHLSDEHRERLLSAVYGVCIYSENLLRIILQNGPEALDLDAVDATKDAFLKADLLILTAALMLNRELRGWRKHTLALIAEQADAYVCTIEDELLSRDPELRQLLAQPPGPAISLEEYSKRRGL
ncbi:MAG: hypothetical protein A2Z21_01180 [Candidatus Fraserbacteria bacterium RBG_16_55_9]|uniref:Uncharacterized protein n=1 Tax=Fraserbacteria sp. (strain RBG_16_55_9) TaxID=1817864 RepID=A0A1F5UQ37_FRAXR|nr:MAG: hypothetical protein A2Z21_01180 [Candidatus Fraserbacteria bacterium RBG_16_55_9]